MTGPTILERDLLESCRAIATEALRASDELTRAYTAIDNLSAALRALHARGTVIDHELAAVRRRIPARIAANARHRANLEQALHDADAIQALWTHEVLMAQTGQIPRVQ